MIEPLTEKILTFAEVAKMLPKLRAGRPLSPCTVWRWNSTGVRGHKLETCKVGGVTCTSLEAVRRFFARVNGRDPAGPTPAQRRKAAKRAAKKLDNLGIGV